MILADTSVWVDHFRKKPTPLASLLLDGLIAMHPYVMGELLLHGLPKQGPIRKLLLDLPQMPIQNASEVAAFITWERLAGTGIGYVDAHFLLATKLQTGSALLTTDQKLHAQAERLNVAYAP